MAQQPREWFEAVLGRAAQTLVRNIVQDRGHPRYITEAEIAMIRQGVDRGIIRVDGNLFSLLRGQGRYDAFTLNREYFIQFATLVSLIIDYGYPASDCAFEYHLMDICVFKSGKPYIYIETKVGDQSSKKLLGEISGTYATEIRSFMDRPDRGVDALRKAKYIFRDRPKYFGVINPAKKYCFEIQYTDTGFSLEKIPELPKNERVNN